MKNNLETFVKEHRAEFDTFEPSESIWQSIDSGIKIPTSVSVSKISWLKYFTFGASVFALILFLKLGITKGDDKTKSEKKLAYDLTQPSQNIDKEINNESIKPLVNNPSPKKNEIPFLSLKDMISNFRESNQVELNGIRQIENNTTNLGSLILEYDELNDKKSIDDLINRDTLFTGIQTIEINSSFFDININSNTENNTKISTSVSEETQSKLLDKYKFEIVYTKKESMLSITIKSKSKKIITDCEFKAIALLNIKTPEVTNIIIDNIMGKINIADLKGKVCKINNKFGNVKIENCDSDLSLKIGNGDFNISKSKGSVDARVSFGDMSLNDFSGNVIVNIQSGDSKIRNQKGDIQLNSSFGEQNFENISGNLTLVSKSGNIDIKTINGDINSTLNFGDLLIMNQKGNLTSVVTSGNTTIVDQTGNGNIENHFGIQKIENLVGELHLKCQSGDISLNHVQGKATIIENFGNITLDNFIGGLSIESTNGNIHGKNVEINEETNLTSQFGDIEIDFVNEISDLSFDLISNLGSIKVGKEESDKRLIKNNGKTLLKVETTNGDQTFY